MNVMPSPVGMKAAAEKVIAAGRPTDALNATVSQMMETASSVSTIAWIAPMPPARSPRSHSICHPCQYRK